MHIIFSMIEFRKWTLEFVSNLLILGDGQILNWLSKNMSWFCIDLVLSVDLIREYKNLQGVCSINAANERSIFDWLKSTRNVSGHWRKADPQRWLSDALVTNIYLHFNRRQTTRNIKWTWNIESKNRVMSDDCTRLENSVFRGVLGTRSDLISEFSPRLYPN